jgi:hypothetical protein
MEPPLDEVKLKELLIRRINLKDAITHHNMINMSGRSTEEKADYELRLIKLTKELRQIEIDINNITYGE